ncbi:MAG: zf-TFIIB domain-containing protein [Bacillota bacterium]
MRCPLCDVQMKEVDRRGVRIDVCPECKGVWLDRGELDRLISLDPSGHDHEHEYRDKRPEHKDPYYSHGKPYKKKHKSLLGEIFDIFD